MGKIVLEINEVDKSLYDLLKDFTDEKKMKNFLNDIADFYRHYTDEGNIQNGLKSPERYQDEVLKGKSKAELLNLKEKIKEAIVEEVSFFDPEEFDCGAYPDPDTGCWFVGESCNLGHAVLYAHYIKKIDEML